jgi:hypothetical protein
MEKARTMRIDASLPHNLWIETVECAVYLFNRTPRASNPEFKSPIEVWLAGTDQSGGAEVLTWRPGQKPQLAHLKAYRCKAYTMTVPNQLKIGRHFKLNPRAHIGYLVGYDSTNIYRVWVPRLGKVVRTRDVIFDEDSRFTGSVGITILLLDDLKTLIETITVADAEAQNQKILESDGSGFVWIDEGPAPGNGDDSIDIWRSRR